MAKLRERLHDWLLWRLGRSRHQTRVSWSMTRRQYESRLSADVEEWLNTNLPGRWRLIEYLNSLSVEFYSSADQVLFVLAWSEELKDTSWPFRGGIKKVIR